MAEPRQDPMPLWSDGPAAVDPSPSDAVAQTVAETLLDDALDPVALGCPVVRTAARLSFSGWSRSCWDGARRPGTTFWLSRPSGRRCIRARTRLVGARYLTRQGSEASAMAARIVSARRRGARWVCRAAALATPVVSPPGVAEQGTGLKRRWHEQTTASARTAVPPVREVLGSRNRSPPARRPP